MFTSTLIFLLYRLGQLTIIFLQDAEAADFNDLGELLLGGVGIAVVLAIVFAAVRARLQNSHAAPPRFISITALPSRDENAANGEDPITSDIA